MNLGNQAGKARIRAGAAVLIGVAVAAGCGAPPGGGAASPGASSSAAGSGSGQASPGAGGAPGAARRVLRIGHFPNLTHVHGVLAHAFSRKGQGWFEQRLPGVQVEWFVYNAGPSAMEAMLAGLLDLTYVGPNPAINAFVKSEGEEVRILAGATEGGAALVVQGDGRIQAAKDFRGKRVATPQLGNTQDVACRAWLKQQGYQVTQTGGDVLVLPTANADQLTLFAKGDLDAAWTVEPWVSRLVDEAGAKVLVEEPDAVTTVLAVSTRLLREDGELARRLAAAHAELTAWVEAHPAEAQTLLREELQAETQIAVKPELIASAWPRLRLVNAVRKDKLEEFLKAASEAGFLTETVDLARLVEAP